MFICNCPELRLEDGRTYREGEPIPEVDAWPEPVRQASLDRNEIRRQDGHPKKVSVLSPEQILRRNAAPPWLLKEASRGRVLPLEPGPSETHHQAPGAVVLTAGQGPSLNTRQVDEADPVPAPKPEPRLAPKTAAEPEPTEQPRSRNRKNGRR